MKRRGFMAMLLTAISFPGYAIRPRLRVQCGHTRRGGRCTRIEGHIGAHQRPVSTGIVEVWVENEEDTAYLDPYSYAASTLVENVGMPRRPTC